MARLRACSNRLRTPSLAAAWSFWAHDFEKTSAKAAMDAIVAQSQSVETQLRRARYEGKQLSIIRVAQDDESRLLREQVRARQYIYMHTRIHASRMMRSGCCGSRYIYMHTRIHASRMMRAGCCGSRYMHATCLLHAHIRQFDEAGGAVALTVHAYSHAYTCAYKQGDETRARR